MPEITVVITTYNLEAYIGTCLEELFSGTYQDFDVVLVDDGSNDQTVDIVETYAQRYPGRIHPIFLQKNLGSPAETRNWALNSGFIDGKYVVFLDGDDSLEPEYLERLHMLALQSGADTVICAYDRVEEKSSRVLCTEMQGFPQMISLSLCQWSFVEQTVSQRYRTGASDSRFQSRRGFVLPTGNLS